MPRCGQSRRPALRSRFHQSKTPHLAIQIAASFSVGGASRRSSFSTLRRRRPDAANLHLFNPGIQNILPEVGQPRIQTQESTCRPPSFRFCVGGFARCAAREATQHTSRGISRASATPPAALRRRRQRSHAANLHRRRPVANDQRLVERQTKLPLLQFAHRRDEPGRLPTARLEWVAIGMRQTRETQLYAIQMEVSGAKQPPTSAALAYLPAEQHFYSRSHRRR